MSLKDLKIKIPGKGKADIDISIACNIVGLIFDYTGICLRQNKSKVKISLFARSFIGHILNDNVREGLIDFVRNMDDKEINMLLDDIQNDLKRRK